MTPVGVVVTTRGRERVNRLKNFTKKTPKLDLIVSVHMYYKFYPLFRFKHLHISIIDKNSL